MKQFSRIERYLPQCNNLVKVFTAHVRMVLSSGTCIIAPSMQIAFGTTVVQRQI
eukprot:m.1684290 g.1684290  ORF g.1684290 m.1684290 type:complete len:54 (-) comp243786_c0_seq1:8-169(-)